MKVLIILLCCLLGIVLSDMHWGKCPKIEYQMDGLDLDKYVGKWYEAVRTKTFLFEMGECNTAQYSLNERGNISITNQELRDGRVHSINGEATKTNNPFRFEVDFGGRMSKYFKGDYQIINSDYKDFAIVYSCKDFTFFNVRFVWVLSRKPQMNPDLLQKLLEYSHHELNFPYSSFHFTFQGESLCSKRMNDQ